MAESESSMSTDDTRTGDTPLGVKKPKKRSIVERELETNLTARVTSPVTGEGMSMSRYGRARRLKVVDIEKKPMIDITSPKSETTPNKSPTAYKMHAVNSPYKVKTPKHSIESNINNQIDSIYQENISLSRFNNTSPSPAKKSPKVYVRKDLLNSKEEEDDILMIKDLFSPIRHTIKSTKKLNTSTKSTEKYNTIDLSEKYNKKLTEKSTDINSVQNKQNDKISTDDIKQEVDSKEEFIKKEIDLTEKYNIDQNSMDNTSVVKTLNFDDNSKKKSESKLAISKNELFEIEAKCPYQVGDLAWARMGTFPFWPCIITRDPYSEMFVKKKLFGRVEHNILHVTFFADNGRRSWIVDNMLRPYNGRAEFETTRDKFTTEDKKKDPRLYAAFFISEKKQALWNISVDEAESLLKEPKRLRIDILNDLIYKARASKKQTKSGKITRTDSDVSLSESLYDSLFSEDDSKTEEGRRNRSRNPKSFDVSDVVTACLDNMAAKTGNSKIQRQSHMDRWLQKAKSKTPEKNQGKQIVKIERKSARVRKSKSSKKSVTKSSSVSYTDESNISDIEVKSSIGKDSSEEGMSVCDSKTSEGFKTPISLVDDAEKSLIDDNTDIIIKQELIDQENVKNVDTKTGDETVNLEEEITNTDNIIDNQNVVFECESKDVVEEKNTDLNVQDFDGKIDSNNVPSKSKNKEINNTAKENANQWEAMDIDDNSVQESNVEKNAIEEKSTSIFNGNSTQSNINSDKSADILKNFDASESNEVNSINSSDALEKQRSCDMMNKDDTLTSELKSEDSPITVATGPNEKEKSIFLDEGPILPKENGKDNLTTNFLEYDHKHLRDENVSIDGNSDKENKAIDNSISEIVPDNEDKRIRNKDENLYSTLHNKNMRNNEISANEVKEDSTKNKIDDVLNESGNSESLLQSNVLELYENEQPEAKVEKEIDETINRQEIICNDLAVSDLATKSKEAMQFSISNNDINVTKSDIIGSSTPKHTQEYKVQHKATFNIDKPDTNEYYEIEDSDEEPSPEYEPLGEDITEDFRKHMQTIEQCVTDKRDEAQIVKICDQITKTVKQEILESSSPTKVHSQMPEKSPIKSTENIGKISPKSQLTNEITPKKIAKLKVINVSKTSLPDKSIEDLINELSPEKKSETKTKSSNLELNTTPLRTRSKTKKFNVNNIKAIQLEKIDNESSKEPKIVENGEIDHKNDLVINKTAESKRGSVVNGSIEEIYSKMRAKEPKVVLTPLKNVNKETFKTEKNKRSDKQFSLSLKKNRLYEIDSSDSDTSFKVESIKEESKTKTTIKPIENGIDATIPISQQNGHSSKRLDTPKLAEDDDFDVDAASISSDDSDVSSVNTSIPTPRRSSRCRTKFGNGGGYSEFLHYFELRQDYLLDEYPGLDLDEDEIEIYIQKTWEYEESLKCDVKKNDDIRHSNLVKGLKQDTPKKESSSKKSKKAKPKNCIENYFSESKVKSEPVSIKSETIAEVNHIIDVQPSISQSEIKVNRDKNLTEINETTTPISDRGKADNDIKITTPVTPTVTIDLTEDNQINLDPTTVKQETDATISKHISTPTSSKKKRHSNSDTPKLNHIIENKKVPIKNEKDIDSVSIDSDSEIPLRQLRSKVLKEKVTSTRESSPAITAVKEESNVVVSDDEPLNKHKKKKNDKKTDNSYDDPEFVKFLELRQDALIDENPQLTQEEIVDYLYKTWLYEENSKSEIKKNDEFEQSNLVKGLNQDSVPKKAKRKQKLDKGTNRIDDETINREKPRRKIVQPFYNEEFYSDIEEEIELFEIFRKKPTITKKETKLTENIVKDEKCSEIIEIKDDSDKITPNNEATNDLVTQNDVVLVDEATVLDSWETYFADLLKPKPNVFKGLIREKVCEICEKTSNLYKCKGCNGMFHPDCLKKVEDVIEINTPNRGRKKKKKSTRKYKSLEDSESQDEKPQDVSEEQIGSIEDIMADTVTVDADTLEAQLIEKMKEMLNADDVHYDSYSSDDGIDWSESIPGKCEIVDVKLKPKTPTVDYTNFKCNDCQQFETPVCFVCKLAVSKNNVKMRQKCHIAQCHKYYHIECLDHWPQTQFLSGEPSRHNKKINEFFEALACPRHVCHTCVSDDPRGCRTRFSGDKLARCVRCPATYHSFTKCLPAGSQILTASQIICPRHYQQAVRPGKVPCHVNTGWCFICALGGSLICCEYCPTSFHAECLNIKPPEGNYMCEDCETGRLPLYGEMVWVKLGHYRWWPGIILHPSEISENIMSVKHSLGEFVVRFFGQYDHYWVNRGRVFPYQEGDSGRISNQKTKIDSDFSTAMEHAQRAFEILKNANPNEEESDIASSLLPPHYVKLKCNKPCGSLISRREDPALSLTQCECDPEENDPCGPYSHCLNRMLLTECGPTCRAGERCNNRAFERRLYPRLAPARTKHRGWGLKTLEDIKAGQFVIEYVGELIDEEEFRRRMRRKHEIRDENFYFLTLDKERMIDAGPKGNLARFMNHCCEPNCETQKWTVLGDVRVGLFAICDIPANSEVTFNYNLECAGIDKKRCMCGAKRCAGYIGAKPKQDENNSKKGKSKLTNHTNKESNPLTKRTYNKKRKTDEITKTKPKKPLGRPPKPKELTEIEKDLLIIKNATNSSENNSTSSKTDTNNVTSSNDIDVTKNKNSTTNTSSSKNINNHVLSSKNTGKDIVNNKNTTIENFISCNNSIKNTKNVINSEIATDNCTNSESAIFDSSKDIKDVIDDVASCNNSIILNSEKATDILISSENAINDSVTSSEGANHNKNSEERILNNVDTKLLTTKDSEINTIDSEIATINITSENNSSESKTQNLNEKTKSLKRKLISNSIEESSVSSSATKRQKCDEVGD